MQAHLVRASEVKKAIEWILCNTDGHYAADSVAAAIAVGAVAAETVQDTGFKGGSLVSFPLGKASSKAPPLQGKSSDASSLMNMSRNFRFSSYNLFVFLMYSLNVSQVSVTQAFVLILELIRHFISYLYRADVLRENTEAVFAACEVTHARWAKLLGVRAHLHPKLKLQEFMSIYDLTQDFVTASEKVFALNFSSHKR